jgi:ferredoxin
VSLSPLVMPSLLGGMPRMGLLIVLIVASLLLQLEGFGMRIRPTRRSGVLSMEIAPFKKARRQNVPGNLYVDESCIDCDTCRWMSPKTFSRIGIKSAVTAQPEDEAQKLQAYAAMVACPTGSIRTYAPDPLIKAAFEAFPAEIDPGTRVWV